MNNKIITILLIMCLLGIGYGIYHDKVEVPAAIDRCNKIAVNFEKLRHPDVDDLEVTNQDIASYMKNMNSCLVDSL